MDEYDECVQILDEMKAKKKIVKRPSLFNHIMTLVLICFTLASIVLLIISYESDYKGPKYSNVLLLPTILIDHLRRYYIKSGTRLSKIMHVLVWIGLFVCLIYIAYRAINI